MNKNKQFKGLYLFYVKKYNLFKNDYVTVVYKCYTEDAIHTMGEIYYRTMESIKRIDFNEYSAEREKYCIDKGLTILSWTDKYI